MSKVSKVSMIPMTTVIVIMVILLIISMMIEQTLQQFLLQGDSRRSEKMRDEEDVLAEGEVGELGVQGERGEHDNRRISSEI